MLYNLFDVVANDEGIESASAMGIDDSGRFYGGAGTAFIAVPIPTRP